MTSIKRRYLVGLAVFSITVVGYTLIGGFLASVWTDMFQSVLMAIGVVLLFLLVVPAASHAGLSAPTLDAVQVTGPGFASGPGFSLTGRSFLPPTLALSYFFVWIFGGLGTPAGMIRVMAGKDTRTLRRSIVVLSIYNMLIYLPLLVLCICTGQFSRRSRHPDEVVPRLALWATHDMPGGSLVSGLILAAPLGAVMSTVSTYLVVIASGLVRDVYQHFFRPSASQAEVRRAAHGVMIVLGLIAVAANVHPVHYLQALIVFSAAACGATFFVPAWMLAYWPRATAAGTGAAMLAGAGTILGLLIAGLVLAHLGWQQPIDQETSFASIIRMAFIRSSSRLAASLVAGVLVSLVTKASAAGCRGQAVSAAAGDTRARLLLSGGLTARRSRARWPIAAEGAAANSLLAANFRIFTTSLSRFSFRDSANPVAARAVARCEKPCVRGASLADSIAAVGNAFRPGGQPRFVL